MNKLKYEKCFRLPNYCTVFQAEINAINEAALYLASIESYKYVRVFIDSQAAIKALASRDVKSKLVMETIRSLNIACMTRQVELYWTKAHIGTIGNERADEGAKRGGLMENYNDVEIPKSEMKLKIKEYFYKLWENEWGNYHKARMTKLFYPSLNPNQAKYILKLGRLETSRVIKLITGHNGLFYFKSKVDPQINPCLLYTSPSPRDS